MKNKLKSDIVEADFIAATPIKVKKNNIKFLESTILPPEKDVIIVKRNKVRK